MKRPESDISWLEARANMPDAHEQHPNANKLLSYIERIEGANEGLQERVAQLEANATREVRADEVTDEQEWWCEGAWLSGSGTQAPEVLRRTWISDDDVNKHPVLVRTRPQPSPTDKVLSIADESGVDMTRDQATAFAAYFAEQLS